MSLWESYKAIAPRTRIFLGLGLMLNAGLALHFSDEIEGALGLKATPQDERKLHDSLPRISSISRDAK